MWSFQRHAGWLRSPGKVFSILFMPTTFATGLDIDSADSFRDARRFYISALTGSALVWIYLLYFSGAQTFANMYFQFPEREKVFYMAIGIASTIPPAIVLFLALRSSYKDKLSLRLFLMMFFYSAGALLFVITAIAVGVCIYALWNPISPDQAMSTKLTLSEAAGSPALCNVVRSIECQVLLKLGPSSLYYLAFTLTGILLYYIIITAAMIRCRLGGRIKYPVLVSGTFLGLVLCILLYGTELLAAAEPWIPLDDRLKGIVSYSRCAADLRRGAPAEAKAHCIKATEQGTLSRYEAAHTHLCLVLVQLNDYDAALKACDNAVRANNNSSVAYLARGAAYSSMGYFGKALEDLQASQKLQPQRPLVYFMLGEAYYKLRRVDEALANYELAEQKGMHNAKLYVSRAKSRIRLKEEEARAIKDLKMAEADDKGNAEIYLAWSSLYKNKNQLKEAFPFLERAKQLDPKSVEVYRFRCDIFPNRSNLEIIQDCNEAIRLEPANPLNYLFRGRVYAKMDCQDLADANYDAGFHLLAMQILEDRRQARYKSDELNEARHLGNLAFAAILAGKYERAIAESDNALKLAKDQLWIELNKAHALTFAKREDEGKALYLSHEGESFGGRQWKHMLQDDFRWLRSAVRDKGDRVNDRIGALFDSVEHTLNMESTRGPQPDLDISRPCSQL